MVVLEGQARRGATEGVSSGVEVVHAAGEGDEALAASGGVALDGSRWRPPIASSPSGHAGLAPMSSARVWLLDRLDD